MTVESDILQKRLDKLFRKDIKIITSADIRELYDGLSKDQKDLANSKFRSFLLSKVKEEKIEKIEKEEQIRIEEMSQEIEDRKKYFIGHKICKSVQKVANSAKDPDSIFKDNEFIEDMFGCKIKKIKKRRWEG